MRCNWGRKACNLSCLARTRRGRYGSTSWPEPLRIDDSPYHMHHKFALFDGRLLLNGSFNWTRSASTSNEENLLVIDHPQLVSSYAREFDELWARFAR